MLTFTFSVLYVRLILQTYMCVVYFVLSYFCLYSAVQFPAAIYALQLNSCLVVFFIGNSWHC